MSTSSRNSLVCLFGPTGVGKTRLLTDALPPGFEVVVVDSVQVYRGLDIGSAKPTPEDQARVPHHLIDIRRPDEPFDVGDFVELAEAAVKDIQARGLIPILSGGTAYYFQAFLLGLPSTPPADAEVRSAVAAEWSALGESEFRRVLAEVDPVSEGRIRPHDGYRLQRAREVWLQSGRPLSSFRRTAPAKRGAVFLGALQRPRDELYARIEARVDAMLSAGLEEEVRGLRAAGYGPADPGLRGIGYAQWFPWMDTGEGSVADVRDRIVLESRRYAKRQLTFFRSLEGVRWYDASDPALLADLRVWSLTNAKGWW